MQDGGFLEERSNHAVRPLQDVRICSSSSLRYKRREPQSQSLRRLALVVAAFAQHALDVQALVVPHRGAQVVTGVLVVARGEQARWEVVRGQDRAFTEEDCTLEGVVELADVARPGRR